ncbi:MAG: VOC family protein [Pseudomonadota bacterium]
MEIKKINRIGLAVKDLDKAIDFFVNVLGAKRGVVYRKDESENYQLIEDEIPAEGLKSYYMTLGGLQIELMSPTDEDGNIAKFIQKRGEGLMTLSFQVEDLDAAIRELEEKGVRIVGKMLDHYTQLGDEKVHTPYCFIHPKDFFGNDGGTGRPLDLERERDFTKGMICVKGLCIKGPFYVSAGYIPTRQQGCDRDRGGKRAWQGHGHCPGRGRSPCGGHGP